MCHVVMCHVRRLPLCIVGFWKILHDFRAKLMPQARDPQADFDRKQKTHLITRFTLR